MKMEVQRDFWKHMRSEAIAENKGTYTKPLGKNKDSQPKKPNRELHFHQYTMLNAPRANIL